VNWIPREVYYPLLALFMWVFALVLIPRDRFKPLLFYGLVWGFLAGFLFAWIFKAGLHLMEFKLVEPFSVFGVNLWISFAWIPAIMVFLYHLPSSKRWYFFPVYLLIFALASASIDKLFHGMGLLKYNFWNPWFRFIVAILWF
jgi:hypothetical protein